MRWTCGQHTNRGVAPHVSPLGPWHQIPLGVSRYLETVARSSKYEHAVAPNAGKKRQVLLCGYVKVRGCSSESFQKGDIRCGVCGRHEDGWNWFRGSPRYDCTKHIMGLGLGRGRMGSCWYIGGFALGGV
jgi:hypothetical protein